MTSLEQITRAALDVFPIIYLAAQRHLAILHHARMRAKHDVKIEFQHMAKRIECQASVLVGAQILGALANVQVAGEQPAFVWLQQAGVIGAMARRGDDAKAMSVGIESLGQWFGPNRRGWPHTTRR